MQKALAEVDAQAAPEREKLEVRAGWAWQDMLVRGFVTACGGFVLLTTALLIGFLAKTGLAGMAEVGLRSLLIGPRWKPEADLYGGLPLVLGTFVSASGAALLGATPAMFAAVWLTEFAPNSVRAAYRRVMEIAAALPSVVYGWLALIYLVPIMARVAHALYGADADVGGEGLATSALLLGVMIAPTVLLLSVDALSRVPHNLREASAALGASPWQTAFRVVMPYAWRGLLVAVFFGFARAAGETMAVQMVIGGARKIPSNLFQPTTTISAQIVMDMQNARPGTPASDALFSMSLILLVISVVVVLATKTLSRARRA
jgi:phosphate transport system permease protein